jgi:hypothetical protein
MMRVLSRVLACASLALAAGCADIPGFPGAKPAPEPAPATPPPSTTPAKPPTPEAINEAFSRLNRAFQGEYERIIAARGRRTVAAKPRESFDALFAGLIRLGMIVESQDPLAGTLTVAAPAPRPLTIEEWRTTVAADAPLMGSILCPVLGAYCKTLKFEPDDYVIVINATVLPAANGSEVSLTTRMREIVPRPGTPRRDYPPPTGVYMALDKIWASFDAALAKRPR